MNVPEIYLTEPYNAYAPTQKKKHWHQVIEEQALMAKILAEANSHTLPPNSPNIAQGTVGTAAGAGGNPHPKFYHPILNLTMSASPTTTTAPGKISFGVTGDTDLTNMKIANLTWVFGDGGVGYGQATTHGYTTTGSFQVQMTASALNAATPYMTRSLVSITAPSVTSAFTLSGVGAAPYTASKNTAVQFVNGTTTNNPLNTITYAWNFGSGSNSTSSLANPTYTFTATGSYVVVLGASGSFNILNASTRTIKIV